MNSPTDDNPFVPPADDAETRGESEIVVRMRRVFFDRYRPQGKFLRFWWDAVELFVYGLLNFVRLTRLVRRDFGGLVDYTFTVEFDRLRIGMSSGETLYLDRDEAAKALRFEDENKLILTLSDETDARLLSLDVVNMPSQVMLLRLRGWTENLDETATAVKLERRRRLDIGVKLAAAQFLIANGVLLLHFTVSMALGLHVTPPGTRIPRAAFFATAYAQMSTLLCIHLAVLVLGFLVAALTRQRMGILPLIFYNLLLCGILSAETFSAGGIGLPMEAGDPFIYAVWIYATILPPPFFLLAYLWYFLTAPRTSATVQQEGTP